MTALVVIVTIQYQSWTHCFTLAVCCDACGLLAMGSHVPKHGACAMFDSAPMQASWQGGDVPH